MTNKTSKKALFVSVMSLIICIAMLVGTTFAWFTDSVVSGKNTITAGNLDIELDYSKDMKTWATVKDADDLFNKDALWEPGHTEVVYLTIKNEGSLDLKYQFSMNVANETEAESVLGNKFTLSQYLKFGLVDCDKAFADRGAARKAVEGTAQKLADHAITGYMLDTDADRTLALVVYMPETVGNEANHKTGTAAPSIELGVNLFATQMMSELDSFGNDYDAGAPWIGDVDTNWYFEDPTADEFVIKTAGELAGLAALVNGTATSPVTTFAAQTSSTVQESFKGKTVKLGNSIDLDHKQWTPIGDNAHPFLGNFDGQGYTVSNYNVTNEGWAGLIGHAGKGNAVTISNLNVENVTLVSSRMAGAIVGQIYGNVENCSARAVVITVTPNAVGDSFDNGDKVGGIAGWVGDNGNNHVIKNNTVDNVTLTAYRDVGGIVGYVASSTTIEGNKASNVTITVNQHDKFYGEKDVNCGPIYGRDNGAVIGTNDSGLATYKYTIYYVKNGLQLVKTSESEDVILYRVPADYDETTVNVPEGVTAIGGYAFAHNLNIDKIFLPSSVTTLNDRAFRDTSASEVVLNEGLENISYQAFRNATNVEKVEIPSTVKTISKEAFQYSGVKTLVVPKTVTTIEYGAMRDMKMLESVTIHSSAEIPVFAFRACTNLKEVTLTSGSVTFAGRGMIFTNKENGDGSAITVYVMSEAVKDRLIAADTAAKDYGGYKIVVIDGVSTEADFKTAIKNGGDITVTGDIAIDEIGDFDFSTFGKTGVNAKATLNGYGNKLIRETASGNPLTVSTTEPVVFNDFVFESVKGSAVLETRTNGANITVNDSTFNNLSAPSTGNTGVQVYANDVTMTFNNCTFNNMPVITNSSYPEGIKLVFNNCTFNWVGDNCPGMVQIANDLKITVDFYGCTFNYTTDSQYTTAKTLVSYNWPEASTINFKDVKVVGTRNNDKIWSITSSSNKVTVNTSGTCTYTFNGNALSFENHIG